MNPALAPTVILVVLCFAAIARAQDATHGTTREFNIALGVECVHCHVPSELSAPSKPAFDFARRMSSMVRALNAGPLRATAGVTCWTCHRGRVIPARLPPQSWESFEKAYASAFAQRPDGLGLTMGVYAASLGVECAHCHVPGTWNDPSKRPHGIVASMLDVFEEIPKHFDPAVRVPGTQCYMCHQGTVTIERTAK